MTKVAFTLGGLGDQWTGGVNYIRSLLHAIHTLSPDDIDVIAYVGTRSDPDRFELPPTVRLNRIRVLDRMSAPWLLDKLSTRSSGRPWIRNLALKRDGVDVHSHATPSQDRSLKSIGWIPDFQHIHLPNLFSSRERALRNAAFRNIASYSNLVIVSSDDARRDFVQFAPEFAAKAKVLRFAALPQDPRACSLAELMETYSIDRPYFYVPNQVWSHKNHATLVAALRVAVESVPEISVVCSGSTSDYRDTAFFGGLCAAIERAGIQHNIRFLGLIPYRHVAPLMIHSTAVINPSLFEGWSTTVEEAKALGVPLILSDIAVHREQSPRIANYFPPKSREHLAALLVNANSATFPERSESEISCAVDMHRIRISKFASNYLSILRQANE